MIERTSYNGVTWIDVESPDLPTVRTLMHEFTLDPAVAEELLSPNIAPTFEERGGDLVLILRFPALKHSHGDERAQEIDCILTNNTLITVRYDTIDALIHFGKVFEVTTMLKKEHDGAQLALTPTQLLLNMLDKLYGGVAHELDYIDRTMSDVEEQIFKGHEKEMVRELSLIGRNLLSVRQTLAPHAELLAQATPHFISRAGVDIKPDVELLRADIAHLTARVTQALESLKELRETNNSLLHSKQNEVMKILTILAFVTFPLTLIAGIFSMNTLETPLVGIQGDFYIITGIMLSATIIMFAYFKYKQWL